MKYLLILFLTLPLGCSTTRSYSPAELNFPSRMNIEVNQPILITIRDLRPEADSNLTVENLSKSLKRIYGTNIVISEFLTKPKPNQLSLDIIIKEIEANFGVETTLMPTIIQDTQRAVAYVESRYSKSVAIAQVQNQKVVNMPISKGYWVGSAVVYLNLNNKTEIPLIGSKIESNTLGYSSASMAAEKSWNQISPKIIEIIDSLLLTISK